MLRIRCIIASLALVTSGLYFCSLVQADVAKEEDFLPNVQYTMEKTTNNLYLQKLAEMSAYEIYGQPVKVVIE